MKKNLTLTGMMGVGKSTIGRILSKKLSMQFVDVDQIIEQKQKLTIQNIFERKGEAFFRKLEQKITLQEIKKKNVVLSLGGGSFMNPSVRNSVLLNSKSFWLDLNLNLLEKRLLKSKKRPLLNNKNTIMALEKIYNERKSTYALTNYKIDCNNLTISLITNKIIKLYADN